MRLLTVGFLGSAALQTVIAGGMLPQSTTFKLLPTGAMPKLGGYMPQRLEMKAEKPATLKKAPEGLSAALFGVLKMGVEGKQREFIIAVDEPAGQPAKLFVDTNANGDLTDDPVTQWALREYPGQNGAKYRQSTGGAEVDLLLAGKSERVHLGMYRFDPSDTQRPQLKNVLLYYSDYAYEGQAVLGGKTYKAMLTDDMASGSFAGKAGERGSGVRLLIDVNGNGQFDRRGETYDVKKPFNIGGTTYEFAGLENGPAAAKLVKSMQKVAEILPLPDFSPGKPALAFTKPMTSGKTVSFPSDYKGKVVLLDFWATWCGPCIAELPHLIAAYEKFHDKGFEVLGISLDQPNSGEKLATFCKEKKMPWPQVYDGKFWEAEVAQMYGVDSIPRAFLVDGDTGLIVASGNSLRGEALGKTIEQALAKKAASAR